jgi:putative ABC transport system permease protein
MEHRKVTEKGDMARPLLGVRSEESVMPRGQCLRPTYKDRIMLRNYFLIATRLLRKNKVFSFINIFGLATGIASCMIIAMYVLDELSYEKGFADRENVFRVTTTWIKDGEEGTSAFSSPPIAMDMAHELPEVVAATRIVTMFDVEQHIVRFGDKTFFEKKIFFVDSAFLKIFPFRLKAGDPGTALMAPSSVLISEQTAARVFGTNDPLDEMLIINSGNYADTLRVTGVVARPLFPSHADADFYVNLNSNAWGRWILRQTTWANNNMVGNYVKLMDPSAVRVVETKTAGMLDARAGEELRQSGREKRLGLLPVGKLRLHADLHGSGNGGPGITYLYIIMGIGALILVLGCINFMNLTTAKSAQRAGEVGVRKSMGAFRLNLVAQFLGESLVIVTIALLFAFAMVGIALPVVNPLIQKNLQFTPANFAMMIGAAVSIGAITALLAGSYPAFYLSSLRPTEVLKGRANASGSQWLRKGLVVFQFVITITLISSIFVMQQQLHYMQSKGLGFDAKHLVMIPLRTQESSSQYVSLKNAFGAVQGVHNVSATSSVPSTPLFRDWLVYKKGWTNGQSLRHEVVSVDEGYFDALNVPLVAGRDFRVEMDNVAGDTLTPVRIIVNEASIRALEIPLDEAVGASVYFESGSTRREFMIIGVVRDFHQFSLHRPIVPMLFVLPSDRNHFPYLAAAVSIDQYDETYGMMKSIWEQQVGDIPLEAVFVDQNILALYASERRISGVLTLSTVIAVLISGLGLYGLSVFVAERKTKEIGIRKISGASSRNIIVMLSKEYLTLILIAFLVSVPPGYYAMNMWLENFAFRIEPGVLVFVVPGIAAFILAWLTVSVESFRAARRNPSETLRG